MGGSSGSCNEVEKHCTSKASSGSCKLDDGMFPLTGGGERKAASVCDKFARFQAILTDLPKHVLGCNKALSTVSGEDLTIPPDKDIEGSWELTQAALIQAALLQSCMQYPKYAKELRRLRIVYASCDLAIFSDREGKRIFTALRGTNPFQARDLYDDMLLVFGFPPARVEAAKRIYCRARELFPGY